MPRVVPEYKEQARRRIIETAGTVFIERGYYQSTMDDIASVMGVSKGAIYQYFKSKEQLFYSVIELMITSRKDELLAILTSENPMFIATSDFFDMKIRRSIESRAFGLDLLLEATKNEHLHNRIKALYDAAYHDLMKQVDNLKEDGIVREDADIPLVWRGLVALRDGLITSSMLGAEIEEAKRTWAHLSKLILNQIMSEEPVQ